MQDDKHINPSDDDVAPDADTPGDDTLAPELEQMTESDPSNIVPDVIDHESLT